MADDALTQSDADTLLRMEKVPASAGAFHFPDLGGRIEVPLVSRDEREEFSLDINRKRISLTTGYQTRSSAPYAPSPTTSKTSAAVMW